MQEDEALPLKQDKTTSDFLDALCKLLIPSLHLPLAVSGHLLRVVRKLMLVHF